MAAMPSACRGANASPSARAPSSTAEAGISSVTSSRFTGPADAKRRKYSRYARAVDSRPNPPKAATTAGEGAGSAPNGSSSGTSGSSRSEEAVVCPAAATGGGTPSAAKRRPNTPAKA